MKNIKIILVKVVDKDSSIATWVREHYITEAEKRLGNTGVYVEVLSNTEPLLTIINAMLVRLWTEMI